MNRNATLFMAGLAVAGCATITKGATQVVAVNTPNVPGANCTLTSSAIGTQTVVTPATISLVKGNSDIVVRCTKDCYQDGVGVISSKGNVYLGGAIALGTGAANTYTPEIQVLMTPVPGCGLPPATAHR
jgi:hypothetical protein